MSGEALVDVVEVQIAPQPRVRVMTRSISNADAKVFIRVAVIRRGVKHHFFTTCPAGKYQDGDRFAPPPQSEGEKS